MLLDTGHLTYAGGDPAQAAARYARRIVHVHCKDVRREVLERCRNRDTSFLNAVLEGVFTVPGDGMVDYRSVLEPIARSGYHGWLVVEAEQDPAVAPPHEYAKMGFPHCVRSLQSVCLTIAGGTMARHLQLRSTVLVVLQVALCAAAWSATPADEAQSASVMAYPASFFAAAQPYSAFDMLVYLPGYSFVEANPDVRGFGAATGNVLVDGSRPASKHESLETILRRIPATAVSRIELIRPGSHGIDMQGQAVLANVVRLRGVQLRGSGEVGSGFYERGFSSPRIAGELSRQTEDTLLGLSAARYRTVDDEHGAGERPRVAADGTLLRATDYVQDEGERVTEATGSYELEQPGAALRLNASWNSTAFGADVQETETYPGSGIEYGAEREDERGFEIGASYDRALQSGRQLELIAIHRDTREDSSEQSRDAEEEELFRQDSDARETILRALLRGTRASWTLEGGFEGALNVLDSRSELFENEVAVALPAAAVRVEERRVEAFATATWRRDERWTFEMGGQIEASELAQTGDTQQRESFFYVKPRALATYSPRVADRWSLLIERDVGQLDFDDFVTSTSLSADTVTAGNPDLEPDRTWLMELAWERHFMGSGALVISARHELITDLIDRIPVGDPPFDGVGNIGDGRRSELEIELTLPLQALGLSSGLLKADALWRHGRATDPTTGEERAISADLPFEAALHFRQDLARGNVHWGVDVDFADAATEFMFDEVRIERHGTKVNVFVEFEPASAWNVRVYANNLTDRSSQRER